MEEVSRTVSQATPGAGPSGSGARQPAAGGPRLRWYADVPAVRARQVVADVLVACWCLAWVAVGVAVHGAVSSLVAPTRSVAGSAADAAEQLERGGEAVGRLPLVGGEVQAPLDGAAGAVAGVAEQALRLADLVGDLALALAVLVPLTPVAVVLLLWLPVRLRAARRAGAAHAMLAAGADPDLFAIRALATQPLPALAAVSPDPVGAWRRGDPAVVRALARLELASAGVRAPGDAGASDARAVGGRA
ncbi:hypothetical protein [Aquipuribacter sp. SD81]|uniref:hypothetical protein n=1 Tax=Aquipuribacter sp. SD81 TaxID=3127703 RepID=UPI003016ACF1